MNLLPATAQKKIRMQMRARFLLALSLVLLGGAALSALALTPAEASLILFPTPQAQAPQTDINPSQDNAAVSQTKALLTAMQPFTATSSLDDLLATLSQQGTGIKIDDISYSISRHSMTITGIAAAPSDVNTFRQNLQSDLRFADVQVPVSALLGSQNGSFTITMKVVQ